jgi:hypothetical protein
LVLIVRFTRTGDVAMLRMMGKPDDARSMDDHDPAMSMDGHQHTM